MLKIKIQYFDGCSHAAEAIGLVKRYRQGHPETIVAFIEVTDDAYAAKIGFRGSPTIQINGQDLFDQPVPENPYMSCRFYPQGLPSYEVFVKKINEK